MLVKVHCTSCHSELRIGTLAQNPFAGPHTYCTLCGQPTLVVSQLTTDEYAFNTLADEWNIPYQVLLVFYNAWAANREGYSYLKDYMLAKLSTKLP